EAIIENQFRRCGALAPAYNSIVGSGPNTTILHYVENNRQIQDNELLLVDAGAEYEYYCSDITRTYPANGRFTAAQREIYEIVLAAQLAAIEKVKPGLVFDDIHNTALNMIVDGLLGLGLLTGEREELIKEKKHEKFFMHRTSHWLGTDTHDVGKYKIQEESHKLESGMLITKHGAEILTSRAPKQVNELETIIGRRN
ncbi:MAG: Xaa-Pro aminopeptidase, partial [bacterium]